MELNKKIHNLEQEEIFNIQKKITGLEISLINNTNNTNNNNNNNNNTSNNNTNNTNYTNNTNNFENNIEVNIDEEIYRSMPPIVRMNAFNKSDTI